EFMPLSDIVEVTMLFSDTSVYAANIKKAVAPKPESVSDEALKDSETIETPNVKTVKELADFLSVNIEKTTKTMLIKADDNLKMIVLRGDQELNDVKLKSFF